MSDQNITREDFDLWLEEHQEEVLDSLPQADASLKIWVARLNVGLKLLAKAESEGREDDDTESVSFDDEEEYEDDGG